MLVVARAAHRGAAQVEIGHCATEVPRPDRVPLVRGRQQLRRPDARGGEGGARRAGATITVLDANNDPNTQFAQLQTAATSKQYDAIIVQPIFGTGLVTEVKQAIKNGVKVVNMDQELGPNLSTSAPQVPGLSGNVVFVPTNIGTKLGKLVLDGVRGEEPEPVQRRLPLRHQGIGARCRDPRRLQQVRRRAQQRQGRRRGPELLHAVEGACRRADDDPGELRAST